jgi:hypothetical protein
VVQKQFSCDYHVVVFVGEQTDENKGKVISPDFSTESKAEAYAFKLMAKNPDGMA